MTRGLAALLAAAFALPPLWAVSAVSAAAQQPLTEQSVSMTVLSVTPSTPAASNDARNLTVVLRLVNTTDESLSDVAIVGTRGAPIGSQQALDDAITHPSEPDPSLSQTIPTKDGKPVSTALGARGAATVTFTTTTSVIYGSAGVCICANQIYPLYFAAHTQDVSGVDVTVGSVQTYVPAFYKSDQVQPVQVSWLWPIVERPHRLVDDQAPGEQPVFLDDELASDVATGRLSRLVNVLSAVAGQVPMTVVIDPELVDEIAVMAAGSYQVEDGRKTAAGVGTDAAKQWLTQLRDALGEPNVEVSYTAYADPDVQALVDAGLNWTQTLDSAAQTRVSNALGNPTLVGNVVWPVGESLDQPALAAIVQHGATSVVLNEHTMPSEQTRANGLATVQTSAGPITALVSSNSIERFVSSAMSTTGRGLSVLPDLVAEVAIRAIESPDVGTYVPIVPPRDLDPDPAAAERAILDTAHQFWVKGLTVTSAVANVQPSDRGPLVPPEPTTPVALDAINAARELSQDVPALSSMFSSAADANRFLGSLPAGVQRSESSSWRSDPQGASLFAARLDDQVRKIESGVRITSPPHGTYTLASDNSPLPLTVENTLPVNVTFQLEVVQTLGTGFTARPLEKLVIGAGSPTSPNKVTVKVPTHVDRTGRFSVVATLYTPVGHRAIGCDPLATNSGCGVTLSVHSTGLGLVGVIITVAAGAILALALVVRFIRRMRGRGSAAPPPVTIEPEPVSV